VNKNTILGPSSTTTANLFALVVAFVVFSAFLDFREPYPIPPVTGKTLFYIQRSNNANTVMYELNLLGKNPGRLNMNKPVDVYWIRYAEEGQRKELNYLERTFGYGVTTRMQADSSYQMNFIASKSKVVEVAILGSVKCKAFMVINNKRSILKRIFIQVKEDSWWPKIAYVEFFGIDIEGRQPVYEKMLIND
jgi:hypothetical protein